MCYYIYAGCAVCLFSRSWLGCHGRGPAERESSLCWSARTPCCCPTIKGTQCHVRGKKKSFKDLEESSREVCQKGRILLRILACLRGCRVQLMERRLTARSIVALEGRRPPCISVMARVHRSFLAAPSFFCSPSRLCLCLAIELIGARQFILQASVAPRVSKFQGSGTESACQRMPAALGARNGNPTQRVGSCSASHFEPILLAARSA